MRITNAWPEVLARASGLLVQAAIPVFLLLLGLELARVNIQALAKPAVFVALGRLVFGPGFQQRAHHPREPGDREKRSERGECLHPDHPVSAPARSLGHGPAHLLFFLARLG